MTTVAEGELEAVIGSLEGTLFPSEGDEGVASLFIGALGSCARDAMTVGACSAVSATCNSRPVLIWWSCGGLRRVGFHC